MARPPRGQKHPEGQSPPMSQAPTRPSSNRPFDRVHVRIDGPRLPQRRQSNVRRSRRARPPSLARTESIQRLEPRALRCIDQRLLRRRRLCSPTTRRRESRAARPHQALRLQGYRPRQRGHKRRDVGVETPGAPDCARLSVQPFDALRWRCYTRSWRQWFLHDNGGEYATSHIGPVGPALQSISGHSP